MTRPNLQRCAIYTRKSSDEGLDQAFNSLDAQREAGEAYIKSQASEGWKVLPVLYDDGGYSGGTMERPALQRLLADVDAGRIGVVVVYKIDRLTRSLADFARIVERFDARGVSFVSVTQAFNTTSSMGRLTLNVLLSFAQFEREVTGERIRDKIAASKAKGMWMGGIPPLGYDLPASGSRKLVVNHEEAATVRAIFERYLELGSVHALQDDLVKRGIISKRWVASTGRIMGGVPFSRGALFHLLQNKVYLGQIVHKDAIHAGDHDPIMDAGLFQAVQRTIASHRITRTAKAERGTAVAPFLGKLFDATGTLMSPTHSRGRSGRLYRYYVSAPLQQGASAPRDGSIRRIAAPDLEKLIITTLSEVIPGRNVKPCEVYAVHLIDNAIRIHVPREWRSQMAAVLPDDISAAVEGRELILTRTVVWPLRGGGKTIQSSARRDRSVDPILVNALRRAHALLKRDRKGPFLQDAPRSQYERRLLRLALLAPDLQRDILTGRQPASFTLNTFIRSEVPGDWGQQRLALGWQ